MAGSRLITRWLLAIGILVSSTVVPAAARATDLIGQQVDLTYNFGNVSGVVSAIVGPGSEFVLVGVPGTPNLSTGTIDITVDSVTLTHNRSTRLGPGQPFIDDDFLEFSFPNLPVPIETVTLTADPLPEWFGGLAFTNTTITLTQLLDNAGVNTSLKVWTVFQRSGNFWSGANWGELVWRSITAVPAVHVLGLFVLSALLVGTGTHLTRRPRRKGDAE